MGGEYGADGAAEYPAITLDEEKNANEMLTVIAESSADEGVYQPKPPIPTRSHIHDGTWGSSNSEMALSCNSVLRHEWNAHFDRRAAFRRTGAADGFHLEGAS
jgi:hypothetical protein